MDYKEVNVGSYYRISLDAPDDLVGGLHPFRGVLVQVIDKYGMTMAGFDTFVHLIATREELAYLHKSVADKFEINWLDMYLGNSKAILRPDNLVLDPCCYYVDVNAEVLQESLVFTKLATTDNFDDWITMLDYVPHNNEIFLATWGYAVSEEMFSVLEKPIALELAKAMLNWVLELNMSEGSFYDRNPSAQDYAENNVYYEYDENGMLKE
jgi:hypothetical protein